MATINIDQYKTLARDMNNFKPRAPELIAELCLDVYPLFSTAIRAHVRAIIIRELKGNK